MATTGTSRATSAVSSAPNTHWSRSTLADQLVGELNLDRNATGGSVSTRVDNICQMAFSDLYMRYAWKWRRTRATMSVTTATETQRGGVQSTAIGTWTGTSDATMAGTYTGSGAHNWTCTLDDSGTVGSGTITLTVTDQNGETVGTVSLGSTYTPGTAAAIADGITVSFSAGTTVADDVFYIDVTDDTSIFPLRNVPGGTDYSPFHKLDQRWVEENEKNGTILFTEDLPLFESARKSYDAGDTDTPRMALIEPDEDLTAEFGWRIHLDVAPSESLDYDFIYQRKDPALADTAVPVWPDFMFRLWHLNTKWRIQQAFGYEEWKSTYTGFSGMLEDQKPELDETMVSSSPRLSSGYNDTAFFASSAYGTGVAGPPCRRD